MTDHSHTARARIFPGMVALLGLVLALGGVRLVGLGGSWYYLITGVALLASSVYLWRGNALGGWIYAATLAWTLVWSLAEVGLDFWTLVPRLTLLFVLGLWLLTPQYRRTVVEGPVSATGGKAVAGALTAAMAAVTVVGLVKGDKHETKASGALPQVQQALASHGAEGDWLHYGNSQGGQRFSPLDQITPENVKDLEVAWTYRTGDYPPSEGPNRRFEATPLKVGDSLYFCTPRNDIVALNAETGEERWRFEAKVDLHGVTGSAACRGVAYAELPQPQAGGVCQQRIIGPTVDARLLAVDAKTGQACPDFGVNGEVDLKKGMGEIIPGYYYVSSAPQVVRGKVVVGGWVSDGQMTGEPAGVIRAFDVQSGAFAWAFDMGKPDFHGEPAQGEHYTRGTPNSWGPMSADDALGMVYIPTGNATPDYYGGHRTEMDNKFSGSVLAVHADNGHLAWHFQTTHYDLWDYDVGSQPSLLDLQLNGETVPVLVQPTKRGQNFVLNRRTGEPVFEVQELPVPQGGIEDPARLSKTQPHSTGMPTFAGLDPEETFGVGEKDMWGMTMLDQLWCRIEFKKARWEGPMTPAGRDTVFFFPGSLGGSNWGSVSFDPERQIMVGNWNRMPMLLKLIDRAEADRRGLKAADGSPGTAVGGAAPQEGVPYAADLKPFLSPLGAPCIAPPYALVTAIDLNTQQVIWERRSGTAEDSGVAGIRTHLPIPMGVPGLGGSVVTKGGLVFIAASGEQSLRAMDLKTGDVLWKGRLPAGGNATPMSYTSDASGRQFVVIAAGGHNLMQTEPGDYMVAYALPKRP